MTPAELKTLLQFTITNNNPTLITGKPGIGKTDIIKDSAANVGADIIFSHPVVSDPTDYKGLPFAVPSTMTAEFLPFGDLNKLINAKQKTVYFLDDLGQATPAVQAAVMQLLLERRINSHKISDHVTFVAATNRKQDRAGVTGILEPVKSRFHTIVELTVNTEDWVRWALTTGNMPTELIAFIKFRPDLLDNATPTSEIVNSPSPRTVANLGVMQRNNIPDAIKFEAFKGAVGEGFAIEYNAFLELYKLLPTIAQIFAAPSVADVPTEPSMLFAICGAIAGKVNDINADNAFEYLKRLPVEMQNSCVKDISIKTPDVMQTRAAMLWQSENGNNILG